MCSGGSRERYLDGADERWINNWSGDITTYVKGKLNCLLLCLHVHDRWIAGFISWKMGTFNYGSEKTEDNNIWIGWFWFSVLRRSPSLASLFSVHFRHGYRERIPCLKSTYYDTSKATKQNVSFTFGTGTFAKISKWYFLSSIWRFSRDEERQS